MKTLLLSLYVIAVVFTLGCTRPESEKTEVRLVLPTQLSKSQSLSSDETLKYVAINATGDGFNPIFQPWNGCQTQNCTAPASFVLSIPKGSGRLIQVLAVYETSSQQMRFYYGDAKVDLTETSKDLAINLLLATSSQAIQGNVAGRYLTGTNSGPTSEINIRYQPEGKPSLIVEKSSMVNGWFRLFGFQDIKFTYELAATGELLFGGALNLESSVFAASSSVMRATFPKLKRCYDNNCTSSETQDPQIHVWGYFGANPGLVCRDSSMTLTKMKKMDGSAVLGLASNGASIPSDLTDPNNAGNSYIYFSGGSTMGTGGCPSSADANIYSQYLYVDSSLIDGNGNDSMSGLLPPLAFVTANSQRRPFGVSAGANGADLSGVLLPGVESLITSVKLYKKVIGSTASSLHLDSVACADLATEGYSLAGEGIVNASTRAFTIQSNISASEGTTGTVGVLCFTQNGVEHKKGMFVSSYNFSSFSNSGGGGGSGNAVAATSFDILYHDYKISTGQCHEITLQLADFSSSYPNYQVSNTNNVSFTINLSAVTAVMYSQAGCTGNALSSVTIPAGSTSAKIYFAVSSGSAGSFSATTASFGTSVTKYKNVLVSNGSSPTQVGLTASLDYLPINDCHEYEFYLLDYNQVITPATSSTNVNFSLVYTDGSAVTLGGGIYPELTTACTAGTATSTVTLASGAYRGKIALKMGSTSLSNIKLVLTTPYSGSLYINPAAVADHLEIAPTVGGPLFSTDCYSFTVKAKTAANIDLVPAGSSTIPFNLTINSNAGAIYSSPGCITGGSIGGSSFVLSQSTPQVTFYYSPGPYVGTIAMSASSMFVANNGLATYSTAAVQDPAYMYYYNLRTYLKQSHLYNSGSVFGWNSPTWGGLLWTGISTFDVVAAGGAYPTYANTGAPYYLNYIKMDGSQSTSVLNQSAMPALYSYTAALLVRVDNFSDFGAVMSIGTAGAEVQLRSMYSGTVVELYNPTAGAAQVGPSIGNGWSVVFVRRQPGTVGQNKMGIRSNNGTYVDVIYSYSGADSTVSQFLLGNSAALTNTADASYAEAILVDSYLDEAQTDALYLYFKNKFPTLGLP